MMVRGTPMDWKAPHGKNMLWSLLVNVSHGIWKHGSTHRFQQIGKRVQKIVRMLPGKTTFLTHIEKTKCSG
jgi:hypothetical protein